MLDWLLRSTRMDQERTIAAIFGVPRVLIGMVHVGALPGTPRHHASIEEICAQAVAEARLLGAAGFHGLMIENMHDRPYLKAGVGPEIVAAMTVVGREVRRAVELPLGIQILAGANREAVAAAHACGADFVRVEGFVFAHVADEGLIEADAGELLRYRRRLGAEHIRIFCDVKKKHSSHALTADVDLVATAQAAAFFLADGLIVTGDATGQAADPGEVEALSEAVDIPVVVGSGITPENLGRFATADAFIVGSSLKHGGSWMNPLDPARVEKLVAAFDKLSPPGS